MHLVKLTQCNGRIILKF